MSGPWEDYKPQAASAEEGPWSEFRPQGLVPSQNEMAQAQAAGELEQALRTPGMTPEAIRRMGVQGRQPLNSDVDDMNQQAIDYYAAGGQQSPVWTEPTIFGPDGTPSTQGGALLRGALDPISGNFLDELEAFVEVGSFSGPEYEEAWSRRQQRRMADDPVARNTGQALGVIGTMAAPLAGAARVVGTGRQIGTGMLTGGSLTALSGAGAAAPGERTNNLAGDFIFGAGAGALAPVAATAGREVVQALGDSRIPAIARTSATDVLEDSTLRAPVLRQRLAEAQAAGIENPSVAELMRGAEGAQFGAALGRSPVVREQVISAAQEAASGLGEKSAKKIADTRTLATPDTLKRRTVERGNRDFGAFRERVVSLDPFAAQSFTNDVVEKIPLTPAYKEKLLERLEKGELTGQDLDILRQRASKLERSATADVALVGETLREQIMDVYAKHIPEAAGAVNRYRMGMQAAEGAQEGVKAVASGRALDVAEAGAQMNRVQQAGRNIGAAGEMFSRQLDDPAAAYRFAQNLETNPAEMGALRQVMGDQADELAAYAIETKRAVDGLVGLARGVPLSKGEDVLDNTRRMIEVVVAAPGSLGAGGAMVTGMTARLARALGLGEGQARALASMLMDPQQRDRTIAVLEKAGLPSLGLREIVQASFIATANALATADREPEGFPVPQETVTMGVSQQ